MPKNRCVSGSIACVGAVIGAGFASGREVAAFFSRYGMHSWWLILLSVSVMVALCALCMKSQPKQPYGAQFRQSEANSAKHDLASAPHEAGWCALFSACPRSAVLCARYCVALLMAVIGGAMVSASGHMVALIWASEWAYPLGAVGTLLLAWVMGFGTLKPFTAASGVLACMFLITILTLLKLDAPSVALADISSNTPGFIGLIAAAGRVIAYAAMNLTIAIGVVCRYGKSVRSRCRTSAAFGLILVTLLFISNYLYLKHPSVIDEAFPIVQLLSFRGRVGFTCGALLLYLAILTTLVAILRTLRGAVDNIGTSAIQAVITLGLPLCVSLIGFEEIVDSWYAPAGACCLAFVFWPLWRAQKRKSASAA